jgi:hypothetical protein
MRGCDSKSLLLTIGLSQEHCVALRPLVDALVHSSNESLKRTLIFHDPGFCYNQWGLINIGWIPKVCVDESGEVDLVSGEAA